MLPPMQTEMDGIDSYICINIYVGRASVLSTIIPEQFPFFFFCNLLALIMLTETIGFVLG